MSEAPAQEPSPIPGRVLPVAVWSAAFLAFVGLSRFELSRAGTVFGLYATAVVGACASGLVIWRLGRVDRTWDNLLVGFCCFVLLDAGVNTGRFQEVLAPGALGILGVDVGNAGALASWIAPLSAWLLDLALMGSAVCAGELLAKGLRRHSYLVLAAIVVALADIFSVSVGPTSKLVESERALQLMVLQWPALGIGGILPIMGVGDLLFLSLFLAGARKFELGDKRTLWALLASFAVGYACTILAELFLNVHGLPALPFMCVAFFLANRRQLQMTPDDWRGVAKVSAMFAGVFLAVGIAKALGIL